MNLKVLERWLAREFVLKNKNNVTQAKKIIKMIKNYRRD